MKLILIALLSFSSLVFTSNHARADESQTAQFQVSCDFVLEGVEGPNQEPTVLRFSQTSDAAYQPKLALNLGGYTYWAYVYNQLVEKTWTHEHILAFSFFKGNNDPLGTFVGQLTESPDMQPGQSSGVIELQVNGAMTYNGANYQTLNYSCSFSRLK